MKEKKKNRNKYGSLLMSLYDWVSLFFFDDVRGRETSSGARWMELEVVLLGVYDSTTTLPTYLATYLLHIVFLYCFVTFGSCSFSLSLPVAQQSEKMVNK